MTTTADPPPFPSAVSRPRPAPWLIRAVWVSLTIALIVTLPSLPWRRAVAQLSTVAVGWIAAACMANLLILPLWASEWRLLVPEAFRVAYARMFEIVAVTAAVLNSIPFFAGEASAIALLIGRAGLSRGAALSVLALDQLLVGFAKLAAIAAAAVYAPLPDWLRAGILSLIVGVLALLALLLPLAHRWTTMRDHLLDRATSTTRTWPLRIVSLGAHFDALRQPGRLWRLALLALGKKGAELGGILAVQLAFGLEPAVGSALLVLAALSITTLLPLAPANLGVYEATVFATYRFLDVPAATALGLAVLQHLCFLVPALATGYLLLTLRQLLPRRLPVS